MAGWRVDAMAVVNGVDDSYHINSTGLAIIFQTENINWVLGIRERSVWADRTPTHNKYKTWSYT